MIQRPGLVALFASILRREPDGSHVLVTPAEKRFITVEDSAFTGVSVEVAGRGRDQQVKVTTNLGDEGVIGPDHPLGMRPSPAAGGDGAELAYVKVRGGLEARLGRQAFYDLADAGAVEQGWFGVWSAGASFPPGATSGRDVAALSDDIVDAVSRSDIGVMCVHALSVGFRRIVDQRSV